MGELGSKLRVLKNQNTTDNGPPDDVLPPPDAHQWYSCTDLGNAKRLVAQHGEDLHWCGLWDKWLVWDGKRWIKDDTEEVYRRAKATVLTIYEEVRNAIDETQRKALATHAVKSESEAKIKSMINLARSEPGVPVLPSELDADPWLLNVGNGTLHLESGELREHRREDLITKLIPIEFDPEAECLAWEAFLEQIMAGNQRLIDFLQRAVGYTLTGITSEQVMFFLHGVGANGKSTFINVVSNLMANYGCSTPTDTLMAKKNDAIPNDVARLKGARFVAAVEAEEGRRLAEVLVKQLTGGDIITARFLHQEYFEFKPTFKVWLAANHKPVIRGTDNAIWRRIRLIPFEVTIPEEDRDQKLTEKLCEELPGILYWALAGCAAWRRHSLAAPDEVKAATQGYREEMDVLAGFLDDSCVIAEYAKVSARDIYAAYISWCDDSKERPLSQRRFGMQLTERGFTRLRGGGNRSFWEGVGLIDLGN